MQQQEVAPLIIFDGFKNKTWKKKSMRNVLKQFV